MHKNPCSTWNGDQTTCQSISGCTWNGCTGSPHACSSHTGDSSGCTGAGCSYTSGCSGTGSTPCTNYWWKDDAACTSCTARGCSYNTQCGDHAVHPTCYAAPTACSARACASCPVGGCEKGTGCSCSSSAQCADNYCGWDETETNVCYSPGSGCLKTTCAYVSTGYSSTTCYSAGSGGTPGKRLECIGYTDFYWQAAGTNCGYQSPTCNGNCQNRTEANACSGSDTCATGGAGYSTTNCAANTVCSGGSCAASGTCGTSGYNACTGSGSPDTCQQRGNNYRCDGSNNCNYASSYYYNYVGNGNVCTGSGSEVAGSTTYYAFSADSGACSAPTSPSTGFGARVITDYACNGGGGQGPSVGNVNSSCGTSCCLDQGATTACIASGNVANNFWNFGSGDSTANDYCSSAVVYDCNTNSECQGGFSCAYKSCLSSIMTGYRNSSGSVNFGIDNYGRAVYKGTLYQSTGTSPPAGSLIFAVSGTGAVVWLTLSGDLYLKGVLNQNQSSLSPQSKSVKFANRTGQTAYIDSSGNLSLADFANRMG